jgi:hypothetical protein
MDPGLASWRRLWMSAAVDEIAAVDWRLSTSHHYIEQHLALPSSRAVAAAELMGGGAGAGPILPPPFRPVADVRTSRSETASADRPFEFCLLLNERRVNMVDDRVATSASA